MEYFLCLMRKVLRKGPGLEPPAQNKNLFCHSIRFTFGPRPHILYKKTLNPYNTGRHYFKPTYPASSSGRLIKVFTVVAQRLIPLGFRSAERNLVKICIRQWGLSKSLFRKISQLLVSQYWQYQSAIKSAGLKEPNY